MKKYVTAHEFEVGVIVGAVIVGAVLVLVAVGSAIVVAECLELSCL